MVPAKYSAKNDAADKIPVWGYTFKDLGDDQRSAIRRSVLGDRRAPGGGTDELHAKIGVERRHDVDDLQGDRLERRAGDMRRRRRQRQARDRSTRLSAPMRRTQPSQGWVATKTTQAIAP